MDFLGPTATQAQTGIKMPSLILWSCQKETEFPVQLKQGPAFTQKGNCSNLLNYRLGIESS